MIHRIRHMIGYNRIPLSIFLGIGFFFLSPTSVLSLCLGIPLILLGEGIRTWASGYLEKNKVLQTLGPYSLTRNPLYLGNLLIGFGFALIGNSLLGGMVLIGGLLIIYTATILEEESYLAQCFGEAFKAYTRRVPRFLPRFAWPESGDFRWAQVRAHKELNTWWGLSAGVLIFSVKAWIG